jgi:hypothetical protein
MSERGCSKSQEINNHSPLHLPKNKKTKATTRSATSKLRASPHDGRQEGLQAP